MTAIFETEHGRIEVYESEFVAYFHDQDYEAPLETGGNFKDANGREYHVAFPSRGLGTVAHLSVSMPRTLARAEISAESRHA